MAQGNPEQERLNGRLNSINSELSEAGRTISQAESEVTTADASIGGLAARLADVRGKGYAALGHLDKTVDLLSKKWAEVGPSVRSSVATDLQPLGAQVRALESQTGNLRNEINRSNYIAAEGLSNQLSNEAAQVRARAGTEVARVTAPLREMSTGLASVDRDLKVAETTVGLFAQAHFPMQQGESPVLAVPGKLMEKQKVHGTLFLTNHRFLFEGEREVVLEKHLFIATKKREEFVTVIEQPVGAVQEIVKGRVGLLAGTGVFVRFKPEINLPETPVDVARWEADIVTRFYKYVVGGEADRDITAAHGGTPPAPKIQLARCPSCGAPHSGEIYQGQSSVTCEYCGSAVAIG